MSTLGERLKQLRNKQSGEQFAALLGIHLQSLYRYERGERSPDAELIQTVSKVTGVSLEWLICGTGTMFPEKKPSSPLPAAELRNGLYCAQCEFKKELDQERAERRELNTENRRLWKENCDLKEKCARLEERQAQALQHPFSRNDLDGYNEKPLK